MSHIAIPNDVESAPEQSQAALKNVVASLGSAPNMFRLFSVSPAALAGYMGLSGALSKGQLSAKLRESIALAVAEKNGCDYCLAAHSYISENMLKVSEDQIEESRRAMSDDPKNDAILKFAIELVEARGHVDGSAVTAVRDAGCSDAEILEILAHVALNTLTNYVNSALDTEIDFPQAQALAA